MTADLRQIKHFWVASGPFIESYFLFVSSPGAQDQSTAVLKFFDADGSLVNESNLSVAAAQPSVMEVGQFLESCKLESGIRHAHLMVESDSMVWSGCRLISGSNASMLGEPDIVDSERNGFMPIVFSPARKLMLCAVNRSQEDARLRCQLFFGTRIPEVELAVAPFGARLLSLDMEFEQSIPKDNQKTIRAYLRFGIKGGGAVGVQLLELYPGPRNEEFVSAVG